MIVQVSIYRSHDGLPLSATTDIDGMSEVRECLKYIKILTRHFKDLPDRCVLNLQSFTVYFISALDVTVVVLCEASYPMVLAFSLLDELQREFLLKINSDKIKSARRPYMFLEFDNTVVKIKSRYNNPTSLRTRISLSDMSQEIRLRPPYHVTEDDILPSSKHSRAKPRALVGPDGRLKPASWPECVVVLLNIVCFFLNASRGMVIIGHGHFDAEDVGAYRHGTTLLVMAALMLYQVYLLFHHSRWRPVQLLLIFLLLCCGNLYLHNLRNIYQLVFHISSVTIATVVLHQRSETEKPPGYNV